MKARNDAARKHWPAAGAGQRQRRRDLKVTQKTAWFMLHRLREAWNKEADRLMTGPVEVDETYVGGREKNKHAKKKGSYIE